MRNISANEKMNAVGREELIMIIIKNDKKTKQIIETTSSFSTFVVSRRLCWPQLYEAGLEYGTFFPASNNNYKKRT